MHGIFRFGEAFFSIIWLSPGRARLVTASRAQILQRLPRSGAQQGPLVFRIPPSSLQTRVKNSGHGLILARNPRAGTVEACHQSDVIPALPLPRRMFGEESRGQSFSARNSGFTDQTADFVSLPA